MSWECHPHSLLPLPPPPPLPSHPPPRHRFRIFKALGLGRPADAVEDGESEYDAERRLVGRGMCFGTPFAINFVFKLCQKNVIIKREGKSPNVGKYAQTTRKLKNLAELWMAMVMKVVGVMS